MKIWIVWSWRDVYGLMNVLNKYDHDYHLVLDNSHWPLWSKSFELQSRQYGLALNYIWPLVDVVILPPLYEITVLKWCQWWQWPTNPSQYRIAPIFSTYVHDHVLVHSLVGKLWILSESISLHTHTITQQLLQQSVWSYSLTSRQQSTKPFNTAFPMWTVWTPMRNSMIATFGKKDRLVRNIIKHDLKQFLDAWVDSIIPTSRWQFVYQKIICQRTNRKKVRFHGNSALDQSFNTAIPDHTTNPSRYTVTLHTTDDPAPLLHHKKRRWMLQRGKDITVKTIAI